MKKRNNGLSFTFHTTLGLLVPLLALATGCPPGSGPTDNGFTSDDSGFSPAVGCNLCGDRSVTNIPAPGTLRQTVTTTFEVDPPDSALARVLGLGAFAALAGQDSQSMTTDLEIDSHGVVIDGDSRFATLCRCLIQLPVEDEVEEEEDLLPDFDPPLREPGPCPNGQFPLGRNGLFFGDAGEEFICVRLTSGETCLDCSQANGVWTSMVEFEAEYEALGSLEGVRVIDLQTGTFEEVEILEGDRVTFRLESETRIEAANP